jgi:hypothetical protein
MDKKKIERWVANKFFGKINNGFSVTELDRESPDFEITNGEEIRGLEVTEIYFDDYGTIGHGAIERESVNDKALVNLAKRYYESRKNCPVLVRVQGAKSIRNHVNNILNILLVRNWHGNWSRRTYTLSRSPMVELLVQDLPIEQSEYKRWQNISDNVGYVKILEDTDIQQAIDRKFEKLSRYQSAYKVVDLLIVCHRSRNSGRLSFNNNKANFRGFNQVYFFESPFDAYQVASIN